MELIIDDRFDITYRVMITGIPYHIKVFHHKGHRRGEYEVEYMLEGQKSIKDRTGKDLKHMNDLLRKVEEVLREVVKHRLYIKTLLFRTPDLLRTRYTLRYIDNHGIFSEYDIRHGDKFVILKVR